MPLDQSLNLSVAYEAFGIWNRVFDEDRKENINQLEQFSFECRLNKLTSVFHASVLLLIMNFVITLSK